MNPDPIQLEETAGAVCDWVRTGVHAADCPAGLKDNRFSIRTSWEESRAGALERPGLPERFSVFVTDLALRVLVAVLRILGRLAAAAQHQPRRSPGKPASGEDRTDVRYRVWW